MGCASFLTSEPTYYYYLDLMRNRLIVVIICLMAVFYIFFLIGLVDVFSNMIAVPVITIIILSIISKPIVEWYAIRVTYNDLATVYISMNFVAALCAITLLINYQKLFTELNSIFNQNKAISVKVTAIKYLLFFILTTYYPFRIFINSRNVYKAAKPK